LFGGWLLVDDDEEVEDLTPKRLIILSFPIFILSCPLILEDEVPPASLSSPPVDRPPLTTRSPFVGEADEDRSGVEPSVLDAAE